MVVLSSENLFYLYSQPTDMRNPEAAGLTGSLGFCKILLGNSCNGDVFQ